MGHIFLSNNTLNGSLPDAFVNLKSLQELDLSGNQLTGTLPSAWANMTTVFTPPTNSSDPWIGVSIYLAHNALWGALPAAWGWPGMALSTLDVSHNNLTGRRTNKCTSSRLFD